MIPLCVSMLCLGAGQAPAAPSVALVPEFKLSELRNPDAALWPAYFWLWNAALEPGVLKAQLSDMMAHDARSVCMLPMPHGFRPDSTNSAMDPDYLTPEYLDRVRAAEEAASRLGMTWWLYDEGGWPSGQALGKVVDGHSELTRRSIVRVSIHADAPYLVPADALAVVTEDGDPKAYPPGAVWTPSPPGGSAYLYRIVASGGVDLLNPEATARFIELTHAAYASVLEKDFGKTVRFSFTDEPVAGMPNGPKNLPWFEGIDKAYAEIAGRTFLDDLPKFFADADATAPLDTARARVALYDIVTRRFSDSYFGKLKAWDRAHGLASAGHLGGDDETLGAVKYGYGHLLRQLRQFDVPGVDLIWRQLFPGKAGQSNFPVAAASAAHQNGTRFAFSESFCVYGNGLTPAQMKWLVDYQYIRGINLLVIGCYPLSTKDHQMTGERPHFGAMNPLWDHLPGFHGYVARLGYALSVGRPIVHTALYYPARDMWASGLAAAMAVESYEALGRELMARQCPFDLIDDDTLSSARVEGVELVVGAMRYGTVCCGDVKWMARKALDTVNKFATAGGSVLCVNHVLESDGEPDANHMTSATVGNVGDISGKVAPMVNLSPPNRGIRVAVRQAGAQQIVVLFNEGATNYSGSMKSIGACVSELDLMTGSAKSKELHGNDLALILDSGATRAFVMSASPLPGEGSALTEGASVTIDPARIRAVQCRQTRVGEHDFEITPREIHEIPFSESSTWKAWLGEDFSGEVVYQFDFDAPESWVGGPIQLETGPIEYAATVYMDGVKAGSLLWAPWKVVLSACTAGAHRITIKVANTLANELTSERVTQAWAQKTGPGWPSPYHKRALEFERESRGGGISGPIRLTLLVKP